MKRLQSLEILGIKFGLENIQKLLAELGNPEQHFPSILIAGTNGKGSAGAMLEAICVKNNLRTGYYVSPHLIDVRERIRVNGQKIPEEDFEKCLDKVFRAMDRISLSPTYFEALTAAGFLHFSETKVDCAVVEVGLGGRYDATNAIRQQLSIITTIGLDHEEYLGKTLESIATEKAMISKSSVPMVVGDLPPEARAVVQEICNQTGSMLYAVDHSNIVDAKLEKGFPIFFYRSWNRIIRVNLRGRHQIHNAAVSLVASDVLKRIGWKINTDMVVEALQEVKWPGRLELVPGQDPPVLLDCAHNPMGARALAQFVKDMGWSKCILLFTAMKDKNIGGMLDAMRGNATRIVLTRVEPLARCADVEALTKEALKTGTPYIVEPDPLLALRKALALSSESNLPLVAYGSIYLIGCLFSAFDLTT
jgi:dihydrofolate synthase/folylpolyglutamate synthase